MRLLLFLTLLLSFCSCSYYIGGNMTGNAAISNANFRNVGMATVTASVMYFLGLGSSSSSDRLILDAKKIFMLKLKFKVDKR